MAFCSLESGVGTVRRSPTTKSSPPSTIEDEEIFSVEAIFEIIVRNFVSNSLWE